MILLGGSLLRKVQFPHAGISTPKSYADMTSTEPVQSVFEAEFIMEKDPTHRYNLSSTYAPVHAEFMELRFDGAYNSIL